MYTMILDFIKEKDNSLGYCYIYFIFKEKIIAINRSIPIISSILTMIVLVVWLDDSGK